MEFQPIEVIQPKSETDLNRCRKLDKEGKLMHGGSYPDLSEKVPQNYHVITTQQSEEQSHDDKE